MRPADSDRIAGRVIVVEWTGVRHDPETLIAVAVAIASAGAGAEPGVAAPAESVQLTGGGEYVASAAVAGRVSTSVRLSAVPRRVKAGQSAAIDVRAPGKARCRLTITKGKRTWRSNSLRQVNEQRHSLQFPWIQRPGRGAGRWTATVSCRLRGGRIIVKSARYEVVSSSARRLSSIRVQRPVRVVMAPGNPLEGLGAAPGSPAFGTVLVPGSEWFGGRGVDVVSNGPYDRCVNAPYVCPEHTFGYKWQCVELVNRFLMTLGWSGRIRGNAYQIFDNAPGGAFDKHRAGDGYIPVPGDILVWGGATYGHVAVVDSVGGGRVQFVEQNASASGRNSRAVAGDGRVEQFQRGMPFTGTLHAKANRPAQAPTPTLMPPPANDLAKYNNTIVQWDGDTKAQKTAWLVSNGKRYWIPDGGTFNCLKSRGVAGPVVLPSGVLDRLPDQTGNHATCSSATAPPPPSSAAIVGRPCSTFESAPNCAPARVSSAPNNGAAKLGTFSYGQNLTARCYTTGETLTDGNNADPSDDARTFTSSRWYGIDWAGGRGYVAAVWTTKNNNTLGLPAC
jgi:hypothetical protein